MSSGQGAGFHVHRVGAVLVGTQVSLVRLLFSSGLGMLGYYCIDSKAY